jgi:hypothetical protein
MGQLAKQITDHKTPRKDTRANKIVKEIVIDEPDYQWASKNILSLKAMGLLKVKDIKKSQYPGVLRKEYVYNDYH